MSGIRESKWQGSFTLCGIELKCHVLDDGTPIIEAESLERLLEAWNLPDTPAPTEAEIIEFAKWSRK